MKPLSSSPNTRKKEKKEKEKKRNINIPKQLRITVLENKLYITGAIK
jgi:hypothetical protein